MANLSKQVKFTSTTRIPRKMKKRLKTQFMKVFQEGATQTALKEKGYCITLTK